MKKLLFSLIAAGMVSSSMAQTTLDFDGTDDIVVVGNSMSTALQGTTTFSVEAWVNTSTTTGNGVIVGNYNYPVNNNEMQFLLRRDGSQYTFWVNDGNGYQNVATGFGTVTTGQWQHIAGTWDGTSIRIYVGGIELGTNGALTGPGMPMLSNEVAIGNNTFNEPFTGTIDNIRIWSSARTEAEISATMNQCLAGSEADLLALYTFEDGTGSTTLTDLTGNGYDGTLTLMDETTDWIGSIGGPQEILDLPLSAVSSTICANSSATIELSTSQEGVLYYLRDDSDNSLVDGPEEGASGVSLSTGNIANTTTYNVYASYRDDITALNFDFGSKVDCGDDASIQISGTTITLEAWVYPTIFNGSVNNGNIINKEQNGSGTDFGYMIRCGNNGAINFNLGNGTWNELNAPQGSLVLNQWQHVAATYDGSNMIIYVNGNQVASQPTSISFSPGNTNLTVGNWSNTNDRAFVGRIDEARVWSVAKTVTEIQNNMNQCLTGSEAGLQAYYKMNDGPGSSTLTDLTTNGNDGVLNNDMDPTTDWVEGIECSTCGTQLSNTITITVEDDLAAPVLVNTPVDITTPANAANCEGIVTWTAPTATDNCTASPSITSSHNSGDNFPVGITTVSYTATDDEGNEVTETFDVIVTSDLTASATVTSVYNGEDVSCNGATDGEATVTPSAGTSPYTYLWSDGQTTAVATGLASGTYNVDITDANGCTATASATLNEPVALSGTATTVAETNGNDGSIDLTPAGGTSPYTYSWTGPNGFISTDQNPTALEGGSYEVTITDGNGCTFVLQVTVDSFVGLDELTSNSFNIYPNPSNGVFTVDSPVGGTMEVINSNGQIISATTIPNGKTEHQIAQLAQGVYSVRLTTEYGVQLKKLVIQ